MQDLPQGAPLPYRRAGQTSTIPRPNPLRWRRRTPTPRTSSRPVTLRECLDNFTAPGGRHARAARRCGSGATFAKRTLSPHAAPRASPSTRAGFALVNWVPTKRDRYPSSYRPTSRSTSRRTCHLVQRQGEEPLPDDRPNGGAGPAAVRAKTPRTWRRWRPSASALEPVLAARSCARRGTAGAGGRRAVRAISEHLDDEGAGPGAARGGRTAAAAAPARGPTPPRSKSLAAAGVRGAAGACRRARCARRAGTWRGSAVDSAKVQPPGRGRRGREEAAGGGAVGVGGV